MRICIKNVKNQEKLKEELKKYKNITEITEKGSTTYVGFLTTEDSTIAINGLHGMYIDHRPIECKPLPTKTRLHHLKNRTLHNFRITNIQTLINQSSFRKEKIEEMLIHFLEEYGDSIELNIQQQANVKMYSQIDLYKTKLIFLGIILHIERKTDYKLFIDFKNITSTIENKRKLLLDKQIGPKVSILETEIIKENILFLENNGIFINNVCGINKKALMVRNGIVGDVGRCKMVVSKNECITLLYYDSESLCREAKRRLEKESVYVEYLPVCKQVESVREYSDKLVVKNIPFQASEQDVRKIFESKFKIKELRLPRNREGRLRGFGFVILGGKSEAKAFYEYFGRSTHLYGRRLVIEPSNN